jgi:hypothetical protein
MNPLELWDIVFPCFENNDGSLPNIELHNLLKEEIGIIYEKIRENSTVVTERPVFWNKKLQSEQHIDDVTNAALLVPQRQAEPFHFCVSGLSYQLIEIPALGFYIFQDIIAIDYRMGNQWGAKQVFSFFSLLKELVDLTERGSLTCFVNDGPPNPKIFQDAWENFLDRNRS